MIPYIKCFIDVFKIQIYQMLALRNDTRYSTAQMSTALDGPIMKA